MRSQVTRPASQVKIIALHALRIIAFAALTAIAARIVIPLDPVPFTLTPMAVVLAGMILGSRAGALSQLLYIGVIALNVPIDANMRGAAALAGPTAGYLFGYVAAAFVSGWLVEHGAERVWQRWLAGVAGIAVLYAIGIAVLMAFTGRDLASAWAVGGAPFIAFDLLKAVGAAALVEGGRRLLHRDL